MNHPLTLQTEELEFSLIIGLLTIGFLIFHAVYQPSSISKKLATRFGKDYGHLYHILGRRMLGVLLYGIVPAAVLFAYTPYGWADYGWTIPTDRITWSIVIGLVLLISFLTARTARKADSLAIYPEIRWENWNTRLLLASIAAWLLYFLAYELLYRGFLLFACARAVGAWAGILLSTAFYTITHLPKGMKETIGSIPMGILLGVLTIYSGSILPAFCLHASLSMSNLYFSLRYHPEISYSMRW